jgi:hypothetical protein
MARAIHVSVCIQRVLSAMKYSCVLRNKLSTDQKRSEGGLQFIVMFHYSVAEIRQLSVLEHEISDTAV